MVRNLQIENKVRTRGSGGYQRKVWEKAPLAYIQLYALKKSFRFLISYSFELFVLKTRMTTSISSEAV